MATNEQIDPFEQSRRAMAAALSGNSNTNPDAEARDQREARRMGVTPQAVRDARASGTPLPPHLRNLSLDEIPQRAPGTARYLSNPNNARVAHDDIDGLTAAELVLRAQGNFAGQQLVAPPRRAPTFGNILRGLGSAFVDAVGPDGSVVRGTQLMLGDQLSRTPLGRMRDATGNLIFTPADREAGQTRFLEAQANLERNRPELDGVAGAIYGGAESFVRTSGALAASVATRSPAPLLVAAGTQTSGEAYGRYSARGATANEALLGASGEAAVEVVTELIPIKKLLDVFGADSLKKGIIDAAKGQFADQIGEQIATLAQDAIDTAIANPDKTWNDYWAERPDAAFQTAVATAVQGVLQTGTVGGASLVNAAFQQRQQRQEQQAHAETQARFAENMQKVAEASALRARSPESFEEFVREATADGPVDTIYVDAQVFNQAAQDAGVDLEALAAAVPDLGAQLQNALETEGDLQIPVAGFAAHIAGTDLGAALIDHARVDPNAPSRAEIAAAGENASAEIRAEVERMLGETAGRDDIVQSAENVRQDIKAQLDRAGRFTPQVNDAYASWVSAYYATRSAQLGITPEEMAAKYRLNIAAIASQSEGTTLEQQAEAPAKKGFIEKLVDGLRGSPRAQETTDVVETAKEMVRLVHFSRQTGLTETDPSMRGASPATPAEERARAETAPGRTYFYDSAITERPEYGVGQRSPFTYTAEIDRAALYDMDADPDNLREGRDASAFENAIRDAGYKGFFSNEVVNGAVAVFDPIGLNQIGPIRAWQQFHALNALMAKKANDKRRELVAAQDPNSQEIITTPPREDFRDEAMRELFGVGAALDEQRARYDMIAGAPKSVRVNGERLNLRPTPSARDAAYAYMETNGLQYEPPREYAKVDVARAKRIADAFDQMQHAPDDPLVRASYRAMIEETLAQYQFVKASGLEVSLIEEGMEDPYAASPRLATEDVRKNNHLWVFPTDFGFGGPNASDIDISGNPLLEWTDEYIGDKRLRANDVFRIVHDYFGHVKDGFGFRADGEENAWQSHAAMFTPLARRAMTTETRGQNSWVNYGPFGEQNRTASASETEYAPQKIGLLPEWVSEDGFLGGPNSGVPVGETREPSIYNQETPVDTNSEAFKAWFGDSKVVDENGNPLVVYHGTNAEFDVFDAENGAWLSESEALATEYAGDGTVMPVYVSIQNPVEFVHAEQRKTIGEVISTALSGVRNLSDEQIESARALADGLRDRHGTEAKELFEFWRNDADVVALFKALGYDGISVHEKADRKAKTWAAFDPAQIKSVNNRGTFDPNDPVVYNQETTVATETPEFKAWFGDSKVVDANGKPQIVYRGGAANIDVFGAPSGSRLEGNIFFSDDRFVGASYAHGLRGYDVFREDIGPEHGFYEVYLSIKKPLVINAKGAEWSGIPVPKNFKGAFPRGEGQIDDVAAEAKARGYDGLIVRDVLDQYGGRDQFVVFAPEQIKSVDNRGAFDPNDPIIYNQSDAPTNPPFFSALKRAVADSKTAKAPAAQWKATLAKTAGVKAEELEWTGLNEWMDSNDVSGWTAEDFGSSEALAAMKRLAQERGIVDANGNILRTAVLNFLDAGGIQLEEAVLGSTSSLSDLSELTTPSVVRALRGASTREEAIMQLENDGDAYRALQATHPEIFEAEDGEFNEDWAEQVVDEVYVEDGAAREELDGDAEYSTYKLPGADDTYREFLIRLPQIRGEQFNSSEGHFSGYGDIIGHARFTTRADAEGRKILFLEEVQSTHHETGREQGYKQNAEQADIDAAEQAVRDASDARDVAIRALGDAVRNRARTELGRLNEISDEALEAMSEDGRAARDMEVNALGNALNERTFHYSAESFALRRGWISRTFEADDPEAQRAYIEFRDTQLRSREAQNAYDALTEGIEPAPWTKSWSQLIMKRMTRYAVDNGFDGVAWINGNQQNGGQTGGDGSWFYERNLVNETNAILKKLGSRVEKIDMRTVEARRSEEAIYPEGVPEPEADAFHRPSRSTGFQNGFYLTDKIKEQAAQGFAMFQPKRGHITFGRDITMSPSTITLLRTADLSTFLHETGHFFLEVDAHIASQPDAPQQIKYDFQTLLNWFGVKDIETWNAMSVEEKRPHHERFARGMEMYLLEGRAPTLEMGGLFRRFSAWLKAVYKQLSQLNVTLTDEVRGVMDRMVASEEAIAEAEAAYNLRPFSQDRPAFMDEQQWAEYQAQFADATAEGVHEVESRAARDMKWLSNAKSKALKRLQREANAQRRQVKAEVTEEVRDEPVYRAMRFLTHGIDQDGNPIDGAGKLDLDTLILVYGDEVEGQEPPVWTKLRRGGRYGLVGVGGVHPDVVAETFGFASGDALIRALADAEDINQRIVGLTDARMLERYGDLADERALEEAANLAVANDARMRVLNTEYAALAKATGQPRALAAAAREHAARIVNDMPVRRLKPHHFFTASARAGRNAEKAIRKGDLAQAAVHKRNQIVNLQAARKVIEAKDEVNKALKLFTRITSAKDENIAKTRDMPLVNAARGILAQYGLSRAKNDPVAEIEKLKRYDPDLYADMAVFLALGPSTAKDFQNISFEEFTALRDNVGSLWVMSRQSKQIVLDGQAREIAEVANEMRERLVAIGIPEDRPGTSRAPTPKERFARKLQGARASLRRVEHWVRAIDSGERGIFRKAIWQPVSEAADSYRTDSARFLRRFLDIVQPLEQDLAKKARIAAPEIGYTFNDKAELLHAILHTGNGSNLSKLLLGRGWGGKTADGGLDTSKWDAFVDRMHREGVIRKEHYDFAQAVWDLLEETKPLAQRAHRRMYGRYFAEVTADPFDTPWGEYRGGYVPATTDSFLESDAALRADELAIQENSAAMFPAASNGFTKTRNEDYTRALALDVRLLPMHIDKVLRFAHLGPPVKEVARLIKQRSLAEAMEAQDPVVVSNLLLPWLQRSANQTVSTPMQGEGGKLVDTFFKELRSRTGMQLMFANVSNVLQQVSGIPSAALRVKKGHLARATWQYLRAPTETANAVAGLSEFMANRMSSQIFETRQAIEDMLLNPSKYDKLRKFSERHGYFAQMFAQNITDVVVWTGAYNQQIENGRDEKEAIRIANSVIRDTQNSMSPEDISRFETGTSFVRAFTQFYSHFNNQANLLGTEYLNVLRTTGAKKGAGRLLYLYVVGYAAQAAVADAIAELFRGGWEDEDDDGYLDDLLAWFAGSQVRYGAAMVPVIGPGVNAAMAMADKNPANDRVSVSPAVSMYEGAVRVPVEVYKSIVEGDDFNRRDVRDTFTLLGMLTGTPLGFFGRPVGYLKDVADGKVEPTGPVDFARGLVTGTPSPDSKQ